MFGLVLVLLVFVLVVSIAQILALVSLFHQPHFSIVLAVSYNVRWKNVLLLHSVTVSFPFQHKHAFYSAWFYLVLGFVIHVKDI